MMKEILENIEYDIREKERLIANARNEYIRRVSYHQKQLDKLHKQLEEVMKDG